ncbi:MAG TPA: nuclear transport factor 2 family protein [Acidimicrobiales bacterium]
MTPHPYREAFAARDLDRVVSLLADDVTFHSPVMSESFEGRASAAAILAVALDVFAEPEYTHDLGDGRSHVLVADAHVLGKPVKTTTLLEHDADGKIGEIWLMSRPLTANAAIVEAVTRAVKDRDPGLHDLSKPFADLAAMIDRAAAVLIGELNRSTGAA